MIAPAFVLIDAKTFAVTRYVGNKATHAAQASGLDKQLIEDFRLHPQEEFRISGEPEAA